MIHFKSRTLALVVLLGIARPASSQTIRGRIIDSASGGPVGGAVVRLLLSDTLVVASGLTADSGSFSLSSPTGTFALAVERIGYASYRQDVRLRPGQFLDVEIGLAIQAVRLDSIDVEVIGLSRALLNGGYYDRKKLGHGHFLERAEFAKLDPMNAGEIIRRATGARVVRRNAFTDVILRGINPMRPNCLPLIYLNGGRVTGSFNRLPTDPSEWGSGRFDLGALRADDVEAIEVYTSKASAPMQYLAANSECGVVLIWTRQGD